MSLCIVRRVKGALEDAAKLAKENGWYGTATYEGPMYSGSIRHGQMHGPGRLQYANGDVYEVRRCWGACARGRRL